jgi:hypothetical protein
LWFCFYGFSLNKEVVMGGLMGFAIIGLLGLVLIGGVLSIYCVISEKRSKSKLQQGDDESVAK